jgi:hypothetical protein
MSDAELLPKPSAGHNFEPIKALASEMTHHAGLWSRDVAQGEKHRDAIMVRAFTLREHMEDPDLRVLIRGLIADAKVPTTARSSEFTQLLNLAYHEAKAKPEPSQISRWSGALQFAWSCDPRPPPVDVPKFIEGKGGDVECARKARQKARGEGRATQAKPPAIPVPCTLPDELDGAVVTARKTKTGWQLEPRKVVSGETTPATTA